MLEPDTYESPDEDDPILAELWRVREEMAAEYGYDIRRQLEHSRRLQYLIGNDVVTRSKSGDFELVFKGTGKINLDCLSVPPLALDAPTVQSGGPQHV